MFGSSSGGSNCFSSGQQSFTGNNPKAKRQKALIIALRFGIAMTFVTGLATIMFFLCYGVYWISSLIFGF